MHCTMSDQDVIGHHLSLVVCDAREQALDDAQTLEGLAREAADAADSQILETVTHRFTPQGITVLAVLADSHLAVHSWPERGWLTLDMFTCLPTPTPTEELVDFVLRAFDGRLCGLAQQPRIAGGQAPVSAPAPTTRAPDAGSTHASALDPEWALRLSLHLAEGDSSDLVAGARRELDAGVSGQRSAWISWCSACRGSRVQSDALAGWLIAAAGGRPPRERSLGQNPVNHATNARRAAYMTMRGDATGKDVLVIGDDDLTSVAVATAARCRSITVIDYDQRVLDYVRELSARHGLAIDVRLVDAAAEPPDDLTETFDSVFCDPVPTPTGMRTFFELAGRALRADGVLYTSVVPTDAPNLVDFHRVAAAAGFVVTDMVHGFSEYPGRFTQGPDVEGAFAHGGVEFSESWVRLERFG